MSMIMGATQTLGGVARGRRGIAAAAKRTGQGRSAGVDGPRTAKPSDDTNSIFSDKQRGVQSGEGVAAKSGMGMLGQWVNTAGVSSFLYVVTRTPWLAVPHLETTDLRNVKWERLKGAGFQGCIFDKDNTLTEPYSLQVHPFVEESLEECIRVFGRDSVALYSNSAGLHQFDPDGEEAARLEEAMGVRVLRHAEKKPAGGAEEVEGHFGCEAHRLVMVGDRYMTDVVFGNRLGMLTIRPRPFTTKGEKATVLMARSIEEWFRWRCERKGVGPPPHPLVGEGAPGGDGSSGTLAQRFLGSACR